MSVLNDRHQALMEKTLRFKEEFLDAYVNKMKGNVNEDVIDSFVKLADSLENNITKTAKLELMREKNDIDRANGAGMADVFKMLQERKVRQYQEAQARKEEDIEYKPVGMELSKGEIIKGEDQMDYDNYTKES